MKSRLQKAQVILNLWRVFPVWLIVKTLSGEGTQIVFYEVDRWNQLARRSSKNSLMALGLLLLGNRSFRNLLCQRVRWEGGGIIREHIVSFLFHKEPTLYINAEKIGRGLYIQHGFATIITAKEIGCNCWINQQVTIGYRESKYPPTLGNGVTVTAGAKVLGDITIGDNAIIGANAVVIRDVEPYQIMGGVPAKQIGVNRDHIRYRA